VAKRLICKGKEVASVQSIVGATLTLLSIILIMDSMRLLGRYRDSQGPGFRLGAFHDQLIGYGTLPLSVIEWLMFDDESSLREALR